MILDKKVWRFGCGALLTLCLASCASQKHPGLTPTQPSPAALGRSSSSQDVVATTTTLAALVKTVSGDRVRVHALVPLGASPETYEPTPATLILVEHAALLVENGAGLEAWLQKVIRATRIPDKRILVLSAGIPAPAGASQTNVGTSRGVYANPHFWLDPLYAQIYVQEIAAALVRLDCCANAATYNRNAATELQRLRALDKWIRSRVATIPPQNRTMITFHDAWYYFDRRYGIRDLGSVVTSPGKEPSAADFAALIAKAKSNRVRAIFGEPEYSPKLVEQLASSANIRIVTNLYDDSLGQSPELSTYEGMLRYDVNTIVNALTHGG